MRRLPLLLVLALLGGCQNLPWRPQAAPKPELVMPAAWRTPSVAERNMAERDWRSVFAGPELTALIDEALAGNSDLRLAVLRIGEAQARYGVQRSQLFPSLGLNAAYQRQRQPGFGPDNVDSEAASLGLALPSWEIDLWGRLRDLNEVARQNLLATTDTAAAVRTSLIAQVVLAYIDLLELDAESRVAAETTASREQSLHMVQLRFDAGVVSGVDLQQAKTSLASAEQSRADIERRRTAAENLLAVLVGRNPGALARATQLADFKLPAALGAGLPSALIARRPDLLAAERALAATDANVEAARKAFFPSVSITGFLGTVSPEFSALFDEGREAWSVSPAVSLPIFTAGRLSANLEAVRATQRIAAENYRLAVRNAFLEVENALVAYQRFREQRLALDRQVAADRERLRLVELRNRNGVSSYFEVLDSQRQLFNSELAQVKTTSLTYSAVVQLYRALGGGWDAPAAPTP